MLVHLVAPNTAPSNDHCGATRYHPSSSSVVLETLSTQFGNSGRRRFNPVLAICGYEPLVLDSCRSSLMPLDWFRPLPSTLLNLSLCFLFLAPLGVN